MEGTFSNKNTDALEACKDGGAIHFVWICESAVKSCGGQKSASCFTNYGKGGGWGRVDGGPRKRHECAAHSRLVCTREAKREPKGARAANGAREGFQRGAKEAAV